MCTRYNLTSPPEAVRSYFKVANLPNFPARYNIAPTQPILVVRRTKEGARELAPMRWGLLPNWVKDPKKKFTTLVNARAESVLDKAAFRHPMRYRRCLIPADGFYEWTGKKGAKRPFYLHPRKGGLIAFAGLWERWRGGDGSEMDTAVILTTDANMSVARFHDRMPAILSPEQFDDWLDATRVPAASAAELLQSAPEELLQALELDPKINNSKIEEPGIFEPLQGELI